MANQVNFRIGYQVDRAALNEIRTSLNTIQQLTSRDVMNLNENMNLVQAEAQLQRIQQSATQIGQALERSFNPNLGTLNLTRLNDELRSLNLNQIYNDLNSAGVAGQNAFRDITTRVLTTNLQLRQTHTLLDSMAVTMKNTLRWSVSTSIMNAFTGSIQQAYGYVKNLDRSLNDIRIVTNKSAEDMADFAIQANKAAQALSARTTDYTNASLIYFQQGRHDT